MSDRMKRRRCDRISVRTVAAHLEIARFSGGADGNDERKTA
jgi:hypothetical protein